MAVAVGDVARRGPDQDALRDCGARGLLRRRRRGDRAEHLNREEEERERAHVGDVLHRARHRAALGLLVRRGAAAAPARNPCAEPRAA